jgi:hypothetical protein
MNESKSSKPENGWPLVRNDIGDFGTGAPRGTVALLGGVLAGLGLVWMLYSDLKRSGNASWRLWRGVKNKPV